MPKLDVRPMTVRELRRFFERFEYDDRVVLLDIASPTKVEIHFPQSVGEILEGYRQAEEEQPVIIASPTGELGVWGFLSTSPPTLLVGLTSASIHMN